MRTKLLVRRVLVVICMALLVLGLWINWECVVKPLASHQWSRIHMLFPSPFYLWQWEICIWNDFSYTLIFISGLILGILANTGDIEE